MVLDFFKICTTTFLDNLFGINADSSFRYWEFNHSSSNVDNSDGLVSLSDSSNYFQLSQSSSQKYLGHAITPLNDYCREIFYSRLSSNGEISFCKFFPSGSKENDFSVHNIDNYDSYSSTPADIRDFSSIYSKSFEIEPFLFFRMY
jgi:hypothetical protein